MSGRDRRLLRLAISRAAVRLSREHSVAAVFDIVRMTRDDLALRAVWLFLHQRVEPAIARALAARGLEVDEPSPAADTPRPVALPVPTPDAGPVAGARS